jgi:glycosyltransferase involved in cell wall biosynthesis
MRRQIKVLQVAAADVTVRVLLLPLVKRLQNEGYEVSMACSDGSHARSLASEGYRIHTVQIDRRIAPWSNLRSLVNLYRLMRRERFDIVHVHTPIAAVLGRIAAKLARVPAIVYTAHGFYFHDRMSQYKRKPLIWLERILGQATDRLFTQSKEDAHTAVWEKICDRRKVVWIGNGVDVANFQIATGNTKSDLGLAEDDLVVGFMGRMVREKGILDLLDAVGSASKALPNLRLLLVGDTLDSDRDQETKKLMQQTMDRNDLAERVVFTGFIEDIGKVFSAIDVFALPSYREGMPRTIIEAMASGKPVLATNIRGCREEVVHGVTGFLVPPKDPPTLADAIVKVLSDPGLATSMGQEGRKRALALFDENEVLRRQVEAYQGLVGEKLNSGAAIN